MSESKDAKYHSVLSLISPLAAANFLFFCLEFILALEVRSVSLFSDSIVFLEGASVSVLMSSRLNWSAPGREGFDLLASQRQCFSFRRASCSGCERPRRRDLVRGPAGHNRSRAAADQYRRSLHAEPRHVLESGRVGLPNSHSRDHEYGDHRGCFLDVGIRNDVAGRPSRPRHSLHEWRRSRAYFACRAASIRRRCME
jgi:hypothetical protein